MQDSWKYLRRWVLMNNEVIQGFLKAATLLDQVVNKLELEKVASACAKELKDAGVIFPDELENTVAEFIKAGSAENVRFTTDSYLRHHKRKTAADLGSVLPDENQGTSNADGQDQTEYLPVDQYFLNR